MEPVGRDEPAGPAEPVGLDAVRPLPEPAHLTGDHANA